MHKPCKQKRAARDQAWSGALTWQADAEHMKGVWVPAKAISMRPDPGTMHGNDPFFAQRGMSLIEVMVVVFIIGMSAGVVVMTLPTPKSAAVQAADQFARDITEAQERAFMTGLPVALKLTETGYGVLNWKQTGWSPEGPETVLDRTLEIRMRHDAPGPAQPDYPTEWPEDWPQIVFDPTGVNAPLAFRLTGRVDQVDIMISQTGEVLIDTR